MSLPDGYTQLEYIESTGTQYIDTGFKPNQDTRMICRMQRLTNLTSEGFFGCRTSTSASQFNCYVYSGGWRSGYNTTIGTSSVAPPTNQNLEIDKNKNLFYVDGELLISRDYSNFNCDYSAFIFAHNLAGTPEYGTYRLFTFKIYDNGTLARDFIPCANAAGEAGLYDAVGEDFYHNAGTGVFTSGPAVLPPGEYAKLEYIESTGTQYIDTGFKPDQDTRVIVDTEFNGTTATSSKQLFGGREALTTNSFTLFSYNGKYESTYNTEDKVCYSELISGRFVIDKNKNEITVNGTVYTHTYGTFASPVTMYLFGTNNNGALFSACSAKIYACKIYDNGTLTRDFVPVETEAGDIGLLDALSGVFYGNAGTGEFIAGPEIELPGIAVSVAASTNTSITIEWEAAESASGYRIYRDGVLLDDVTGLSYTDAAPIAYANHVYTVVAYGTGGDVANGSVAGASIWPPGLPPLVTDRGPGAYYTAVDLNRVETAVRYLADQLNAVPAELSAHAADLGVAWSALFDAPYGEIDVEAKNDWTILDLPSRILMERYLSNVETVKSAVEAAYPELPPSMDKLTYSGANNIERALLLLYDALQAEIGRLTTLIDNTAASWYYTGDLYAGEI